MPLGNTLTPGEAGKIALNSYFALKDWINTKPVAGIETRGNVENRVLGAASVGTDKVNSSVGKNLPGASLQQVFQATTGFNTRSGFGYVLQYQQGGKRHAIIAVRGTRPEMAGKPDLVTDARGTLTGFGDFGLVHIDLLTEMLLKGVRMMSGVAGRQIDSLLRMAARWATIADG
jgi:hypothetical protein